MTAAEQKLVDELRARDERKTALIAALRQRLRRMRRLVPEQPKSDQQPIPNWSRMTHAERRMAIRRRMSR